MIEKVEVGDWVRFKGGRRIYEVTEARITGTFRVAGMKRWRLSTDVAQVAPRLWIKKAE